MLLRCALLVVLCSCRPTSALNLGLGPQLASRARPRACASPKYDVAASTDYWAASNLLHDTFGGNTAYYWTTLRAPALNANIFFSPSESICALAAPSDGAEPLGVVQLLLVELRKEAGSGAGKTVAFVQSVAVPPTSRRQGVATRLVGWCEEEAERRWGAVELWLALRTDNEAAQALYTGLGYELVEERLGLLLMRKVPGPTALPSPLPPTTTAVAAAAAATASATATATASATAVAAETATAPSELVAQSLSPLSTPPPPPPLPPPPMGGGGASGGVGVAELGKNLAAQACA
eukprot:scaffold12630_cov71-Phaeocystis_antarctica.AAC.7